MCVLLRIVVASNQSEAPGVMGRWLLLHRKTIATTGF